MHLFLPLIILEEKIVDFLTLDNISLAPSFLRGLQRCNAVKSRCTLQESRPYFRFYVPYSTQANQIETEVLLIGSSVATIRTKMNIALVEYCKHGFSMCSLSLKCLHP